MKKEDEEIIGSKEAAEILRVSRATFLQMIKDEELPISVIKVGKYPRYIKKELEDYWKSRIFKPGTREDKEG